MATTTTDNTPIVTRDTSDRPHFLVGALVGLMLTIAATAVFLLGDVLFGVPFVPFDVLDWIARTLPGGLITFGIDTMVTIITTLQLGETASAAKTAEHIMAISGLIVTGTVMVAGFFFFRNRTHEAASHNQMPGVLLGLALGVPVALISYTTNFTATAAPLVSVVWILAVFVGWGLAAHWAYQRLDVPDKPSVYVEDIDRRAFLIRLGGATATITVLGAGLGTLLRPTPPESSGLASVTVPEDELGLDPQDLPNADAEIEPVPGTRPEYTPVEDHYRIDISARPPILDEAGWMLPIEGLVDNPLALRLSDLRDNYEPMHQFVTLACISNRLGGDLTSTTMWTGVSLQTILAEAGVQEGARYLRIFSADGFDETLNIDLINQDERIMLAYAWDEAPLPIQNGFPLRVYIPDRYGMKQPKWITEILVVADYEEGYWVRRGWDEVAQMKTTSVVDTVATDSIIRREGQFYVPVGGIAHAGARGISKVEVSVDEGEWQEALLREPLSETTWVLWRYEWPFEEGTHTFHVRTYDGNGSLQIEQRNPPHPSGSTGIHSRSATL